MRMERTDPLEQIQLAVHLSGVGVWELTLPDEQGVVARKVRRARLGRAVIAGR